MNLTITACVKLSLAFYKLRPLLANFLFALIIAFLTSQVIADPTHFTLQIYSSRNLQEVESVKNSLLAFGLQAEISTGEISGQGIFYRVRIGDFPTSKAAQFEAERLRTKGWIKNYWITKADKNNTIIVKSAAVTATRDRRIVATSATSRKNPPELALGELISAIDGKWAMRLPENLTMVTAQIVFPKAGVVKPAVVFLNPANSTQIFPTRLKSRELMHPLEMRFEPGVKISPAKYSLSYQQAAQLTASLRYISGYQDLSFDDRGYLVLGSKITGGSELARSLLQAAIYSNEVFEIESLDSSNIVVFGALLTAEYGSKERGYTTFNRIQLDFQDFTALKGTPQVINSFDPGFVFLHELSHGVWKLADNTKSGGIGDCEAFINQIRHQLGLPERMRYYYKVRRVSGGRERAEMWFVNNPQDKSERKSYHKLEWDSTTVGAGGLITPSNTTKETPLPKQE